MFKCFDRKCVRDCEKGIGRKIKWELESKLTYHGIGQGLFTSGILTLKGKNNTLVKKNSKIEKHYKYVYDCGVEGDRSRLDSEISQLITEVNNSLDLLVISHFDYDHISGVDELLKAMYVDRLVIPYLEPKKRLYFALKLAFDFKLDIDSPYYSMVLNPTEYFSQKNIRTIVYVKDTNENPDNEKESIISLEEAPDKRPGNYGSKVTRGKAIDDIATLSNTEVFDNYYTFAFGVVKFQFFNKPLKSKIFEVFSIEVDKIIGSMKIDIGLLKNKSIREALKKLYKTLPNGINDTSICMSVIPTKKMLESKSLSNKCRLRIAIFDEGLCKRCFQKFGYMFTGDIGLKAPNLSRKFMEYYSKVVNEITTFTVPHHGSSNNWRDDLMDVFKNANWIISAGTDNRHDHPSSNVLKSISYKLCSSALVTERDNLYIKDEMYYI